MNDLVILLSLVVVGYTLIIIEFVLVPGLGLPGILGFAALVGAGYQVFTRYPPAIALAITIGGLALLLITLRWLSRSALWKKMYLPRTEQSQNGFTVANSALAALLNKTGTAFTVLRPAGAVIIDGKRYDASTDGEFIEKDAAVIVLKISGTTLIVGKHSD